MQKKKAKKSWRRLNPMGMTCGCYHCCGSNKRHNTRTRSRKKNFKYPQLIGEEREIVSTK